jgi:hypothetical protein
MAIARAALIIDCRALPSLRPSFQLSLDGLELVL